MRYCDDNQRSRRFVRGHFGTLLRRFATALLLILPCAAQNPPGVLYSASIPSGSPGPPDPGAIAQDASGNTYVTGTVFSNGFMTTLGVFQPSAPAGGAAFVAKLDPTGPVVFLTYLGGFIDMGTSIHPGRPRRTYLCGRSNLLVKFFPGRFALPSAPERQHAVHIYRRDFGRREDVNNAYVSLPQINAVAPHKLKGRTDSPCLSSHTPRYAGNY